LETKGKKEEERKKISIEVYAYLYGSWKTKSSKALLLLASHSLFHISQLWLDMGCHVIV
jgi:hypothetical protein